METGPIHSEFLTYQLVTENDKSHFLALYCNPVTMEKLGHPLTPKQANSLHEFVIDSQRPSKAHFYKIASSRTNITMGLMGFLPAKYHQDFGNQAEFGILLYPEYYGNGTAKEAITALIEHGFSDLQLDSVFAKFKQNNLAIEKIAKHLNFQVSADPVVQSGVICRLNRDQYEQALP